MMRRRITARVGNVPWRRNQGTLTSTPVVLLLSGLVILSTIVSFVIGLHRFLPANIRDDRRIVSKESSELLNEQDRVRKQQQRKVDEDRLDRLQKLSRLRVQEAKALDHQRSGANASAPRPVPMLQLRSYPPHVQELHKRWRRRKEHDELLKKQRGNFPTYNRSSLHEILVQTFLDPATSSCVRDKDAGGPNLLEPRGREVSIRANGNRTTIDDHDFVGICLQDELTPRFQFTVPRFLDHTDHAELFRLQPENREALLPNFVDASYKTCVKIPRNPKNVLMKRVGSGCIVGRIEAHDVWSFQHFHDIGLPLALQHQELFDAVQRAQATAGCQPYPVYLSYDLPHNSKVLQEEWARLGFPVNQSLSYGDVDKACGGRGGTVIATTIIKGMSAHPSHFRHLRNRLFPDAMMLNRHKVVWISRSLGLRDSRVVLHRRQVANEPEVMEQLKSRLAGFEVLNPSLDEHVDTVADLRRRLGDACLIVGVHGGQLYNQFFAGTATTILELLPVSDDPEKRGWYHGQTSLVARPVLAHRSIWFNAELIGQPYWRIYVSSADAKSFNITRNVVDQMLQVVEAAGCE